MNLGGQFMGDVGQAAIGARGRIRGVAAQDKFANTKTLAGPKNRTDVVGRADVMGDNDNLSHSSILPRRRLWLSGPV